MKFIDNKVNEIIQEPGIDGLYKMIRNCAAVCYQTDVEKMKLSPKDFVEKVLLKNGHGRPLEFGTVYLKCNSENEEYDEFDLFWNIFVGNQFSTWDSVVEPDGSYTLYITTNMRVLAQGDYESDEEACKNGYDRNYFDILKYWTEPTEYHDKRRTFSMIMSRGCTDDNRTHITFSSLCESTRFCNYSLGKYGNELTFIKPYWFKHDITADGALVGFDCHDENAIIEQQFLNDLRNEEIAYMRNAKLGLQPQQLKRIFPLGAKAELLLCGYDNAWQNFFWRRCDEHADPECVKVAKMIKEIY